MSITQAINAALTGLRATQIQSAILSRNVANAGTPGYVRKDVDLSSLVLGGVGYGVRVDGIARRVDEFLIRDVRNALSGKAEQQVLAEALQYFTDIVGQPQDERSLASLLADFDRQLGELGESPESAPSQQAVVTSAESLVQVFQRTDAAIRQAREDADAQIAESVRTVNNALDRIKALNNEISARGNAGADYTDLKDERDNLIDQIAQEIPIRTVTQENGGVHIMTQGGSTLLDAEVSYLEFTPSPNIPASLQYDPLTPGGLSGLEVDGIDIAPGSGNAGSIPSGRLAGLFQIRDTTMVRFQAQIDEAASQLIAGFQNADATVTGAPPADTGLFTDSGNAHDPAAYVAGLAGRITVNDMVTPEAGGDLWRVRDGIHAAAEGPPADNAQVRQFEAVFDSVMAFDPAAGLQTSAKLLDFASAAVSDQHAIRQQAETSLEGKSIAHDALSTSRLNRDGVNVDDEMQKLLTIERSYAANAQVLETANRMIARLFEF
jgi:flagellar hook-associated protein 1